jgi:post-segregation antitoxin (ccd killing protein)
MTQLGLGPDLSATRRRKREFLEEMRRVVPWSKLIALIEPHYPKGKTGRLVVPIATMLQIHFIQQELGINLSRASERGVREEIQETEARRWADDNAELVAAYTAMVERDGLPLAKYRSF